MSWLLGGGIDILSSIHFDFIGTGKKIRTSREHLQGPRSCQIHQSLRFWRQYRWDNRTPGQIPPCRHSTCGSHRDARALRKNLQLRSHQRRGIRNLLLPLQIKHPELLLSYSFPWKPIITRNWRFVPVSFCFILSLTIDPAFGDLVGPHAHPGLGIVAETRTALIAACLTIPAVPEHVTFLLVREDPVQPGAVGCADCGLCQQNYIRLVKSNRRPQKLELPNVASLN